MADDYKKSNEHLSNAALAAPFILATGNIPAALVGLGIGKLLDYADSKDFERRRKEWENDPHRPIELTPEQWAERFRHDAEVTEQINRLPQVKNALAIRGSSDWKNKDEVYITITSKSGDLQYSRTGIGDGEVVFHFGNTDWYGTKRVRATLYYNAEDFYNKLVSDYKTHPKMEIRKIIVGSYKKGKWFYTMDGGKSFIVGL